MTSGVPGQPQAPSVTRLEYQVPSLEEERAISLNSGYTARPKGDVSIEGIVDDYVGLPEDRPPGGLFEPTRGEIDEFALGRERGNTFNAERSGAYPHNEVTIEFVKPSGKKGYVYLDSYDPGRQIVSRKFPRGAMLDPDRAIDYIVELLDKYPQGTKIADTPAMRAAGIAGQVLRGQPILEVPVLLKEVSSEVLEFAKRVGVIIRDVEGKVY